MRDYHTFDLETDPFNGKDYPKAFLAGYFDGSTTHVFPGANCCADLIDLAVSEGKKRDGELLLYAHNGGKFDFHFVLTEILRHFDKEVVEPHGIGTRLTSIDTPAFELRDSYSLIPKPLKAFGKKLEIDIWKLKEFWEQLSEKERAAHLDILKPLRLSDRALQIAIECPRRFYWDEIVKYLKQDCVGLREGLTEFFNRYGCEITLASTAFKVGKKQFNIKPEHTGLNYDNKFRDFYFAGRVQFFSLGKHGEEDTQKRYSICDINSAFPWAMLSRHWFSGGYSRQDLPPGSNREQCMYEVTCKSEGALPLRASNGGVEFPKTEGKFFATGWELFTAIELGLVTNVKYEAVYVPKETRDFSSYVNYFYEMKKNAVNSWDRDFAKLFLNSYYGKYALNPREFRDIKISKWGEIPDDKRIEVTEEATFRVKRKIANEDYTLSPEGYYTIGDNEYEIKFGKVKKIIRWEHSYDDLQRGLSFWQIPSNDDESKTPMQFYNVATAASITGAVRAFLMRSLHNCSGVLYCDTDSIIAANTARLILGDELGQWKLEKDCDAVWVGAKKLYCAHGLDGKYKTASKGVRLTVEDLKAVCEGEARTYSFEAPNYSVFSKPHFTSRRIVRADKRKK